MNRDEMIEAVELAMDNVHDMDTPWSRYAEAAVDALSWRPVTDRPRDRSFVVVTDGNARWVDTCTFDFAWPPKFGSHVATHWHPVHDLPSTAA